MSSRVMGGLFWRRGYFGVYFVLSTDFYGAERQTAVKLAFFAREKRSDLGPHKWRRREELHVLVPLSHILNSSPFMRP